MRFITGIPKKKKINICTAGICALLVMISPICTMYVHAATTTQEYLDEAEARKELPIETDSIEDWPAGPKIGAEGAVLMEANTGTLLYGKNSHEKLYPASITKMLTALVAMDKCDMDEMVTFSEAAIHSINWREDANMGINPGNSITMEQCLYGLLVGSANEVAYAIAEHIAGDGNIEGFAELMNEKAKELGCTDSNFVTPNGIHDENHYTSAYDMALIAQAFYSNELLTRMASTTSYRVPQTETQPRDDMVVWAKSKLHPGKEYAYEYLVGTKTGYTDVARQTLVSCAQQNGLKLICVIMLEESPAQFTDTIELFDYGFNNFRSVNISDNDTTYVIQSLNFFSTTSDIFGNSKAIIQMNKDDYIVLPADADITDTVSKISYDNLHENSLARVDYYYNDIYVGSADIEAAATEHPIFDFGSAPELDIEPEEEGEVTIVNVRNIILMVLAVAMGLIVIFGIRAFIAGKIHAKRRRGLIEKHRKSGTKNLDWSDFI